MIRKDAMKEDKQEVTLDRITLGGQAIESLVQSIIYMQKRLSKFFEARILKIYTETYEKKSLNPPPLSDNKQLVSDLNQLASKLDYFDQIAFFLLLDESYQSLLDPKWIPVANLIKTLSKEIFSSEALYDLSTNKKIPTPQEIQKQFHIESMDLFLKQLAEKSQVQNKKLVVNPVSFAPRNIRLTIERNLYELPSREFDSVISNYKLRFISIEGPQLEAYGFEENSKFETVAERIKGLSERLPGSFEGRLRTNLPQYEVELLNNLLHPIWMFQALEDVDLYVQLLSEICLNPCYEILFFDLIYYLIRLDQQEFYRKHKFNHHYYDQNDPIVTYQNNLLMVLAKYILRTNTSLIFHTDFGALVTLVEEKLLGFQLPIKKKALEALKKSKNDPIGIYFEEILDPLKVILEGYLSESSLTLPTRTEIFKMFFSIYLQSCPVQREVREIFDNSYLYAFLFSPNLFNRYLYEVLINQLDSAVSLFVEHPQMYQTPLSSLVESEAYNQCKFELEDWVIDFNDYLKEEDKLVFAENIASALDRFLGAEKSFQGQILTFRSIQKYVDAVKQRLGESDEQLKYFDMHQNAIRNILKTTETVTKDDKVRNIFFLTIESLELLPLDLEIENLNASLTFDRVCHPMLDYVIALFCLENSIKVVSDQIEELAALRQDSPDEEEKRTRNRESASPTMRKIRKMRTRVDEGAGFSTLKMAKGQLRGSASATLSSALSKFAQRGKAIISLLEFPKEHVQQLVDFAAALPWLMPLRKKQELWR